MTDERKTVLLNHPDGRICEIPVADLDRYVVPPERVKELSRAAAAKAAEEPPASAPAEAHAPSAEHDVVVPTSGQTVVFNFYLGPQAKLQLHQTGSPPSTEADVEGYHMDLDAFGSMTAHGDWRVGPFIDKSGRPAFGPHSHDPITGNAQ